MKKIFLLPRCEWKYLLFLLFFVFSFLQNAIIRWISWGSHDVAQPFLNTYLFIVSDYLAVIPFIIIKIRSRRVTEENILAMQMTLNSTTGGTSSKNMYKILFIV